MIMRSVKDFRLGAVVEDAFAPLRGSFDDEDEDENDDEDDASIPRDEDGCVQRDDPAPRRWCW